MWDMLTKLDTLASLIGVIVAVIAGMISVYWNQHKKIVQLEHRLKELVNTEGLPTFVDAILPNVDAAKAKILHLINESRDQHRTLRIDNFGLDLETIGSMFRYTLNSSVANRDIVYRGLIIDPCSEAITKICTGKSNLCQKVATKVISQVREMIESGESTISIQIVSYDIPPVMHGFLIDDEHLLIGFTNFIDGGLIGGASPYMYIKRNRSDAFKESMFITYKSWFEYLLRNGQLQLSSDNVR